MSTTWRPDLSDTSVLTGLRPRSAPYFNLISYCRHIGVEVHGFGTAFWVARVRRKDGGYARKRLGAALTADQLVMSYAEAISRADQWFDDPSIARIASEPYPLGSKRSLSICPFGPDYTVGHALEDYIEWKQLAATRSHFETIVSMVNYHLVPRISSILLKDFNGRHFHDLAVDVIETPPKRGREAPTDRVPLKQLSDEELRKRKKTLNTLVSILRGAFQLAWDMDELESDKPIRCLRRLPNADRPRVVFLSRNECRNLLAACHPDLRPLVLGALFTGCRANELTQMKVRDFMAGDAAVYVASPKGRRTRYVFLPPEGIRHFEGLAIGRNPDELLFHKANGRSWGAEYKDYFVSARTIAGLSDRVTFHGLRHTYASQLIQNGASLLTVADQLGHANVQTVSDTYGHLTAHRRAEEVARCFPVLVGSDTRNEGNVAYTRPKKVPVFRHIDPLPWPRANHAKFSGPLLRDLSPHAATLSKR